MDLFATFMEKLSLSTSSETKADFAKFGHLISETNLVSPMFSISDMTMAVGRILLGWVRAPEA